MWRLRLCLLYFTVLTLFLSTKFWFVIFSYELQTIKIKSWLQVVYDTNGFLEKNRDLLHADLLQLLASCDCALPQLFGAVIGDDAQKLLSPTRRANGTESQKQSVAAKFKVWSVCLWSSSMPYIPYANKYQCVCDTPESLWMIHVSFASSSQ